MYLVCSIILGASTKFVQIMPLGPEMAPCRGSHVLQKAYIGKHEKKSCLEPLGIDRALVFGL